LADPVRIPPGKSGAARAHCHVAVWAFQRLFQDEWLAFIAAAIFALHPIHTESVAWVSGVTDLNLAGVLTRNLWYSSPAPGPRGDARSGCISAWWGFHFGSAFGKSMAVTLPLLATLLSTITAMIAPVLPKTEVAR